MSINTISKQEVNDLHKPNENTEIDFIPNQRRSSKGEAYRSIREKQDDNEIKKLNKWFDKECYETLLD